MYFFAIEMTSRRFASTISFFACAALTLALLDDGHDALDLVGPGVGARLGGLDLLLGDPDLLLLGAGNFLAALRWRSPAPPVAPLAARVAERDVDEVLDLLRRRAAAVGPELDHPLGALDVVEQVAQALHQAAAAGSGVLAVDDLVADVQRAQLLEHLAAGAAAPGASNCFQAGSLPLPSCGRRRPDALSRELARLLEELVALAQQPVDAGEGGDDLPRERGLLLLGELLLVDVDDFLDRDVGRAELLAQLAEALEGQVGGEDGVA